MVLHNLQVRDSIKAFFIVGEPHVPLFGHFHRPRVIMARLVSETFLGAAVERVDPWVVFCVPGPVAFVRKVLPQEAEALRVDVLP